MSSETEDRIPFDTPPMTSREKEVCNSSGYEIIWYYLNYPNYFLEEMKSFSLNTWLEIFLYFITFGISCYIYYCLFVYLINLIIDYLIW